MNEKQRILRLKLSKIPRKNEKCGGYFLTKDRSKIRMTQEEFTNATSNEGEGKGNFLTPEQMTEMISRHLEEETPQRQSSQRNKTIQSFISSIQGLAKKIFDEIEKFQKFLEEDSQAKCSNAIKVLFNQIERVSFDDCFEDVVECLVEGKEIGSCKEANQKLEESLNQILQKYKEVTKLEMFENGERYEGDFFQGKRHGKGKYFFSDGYFFIPLPK